MFFMNVLFIKTLIYFNDDLPWGGGVGGGIVQISGQWEAIPAAHTHIWTGKYTIYYCI